MTRHADHPIDPQFLNRHSPRAFTDESLDAAGLLSLLEAARWAPSGSNIQPARYAWGLRGDPGFAAIAATLAESNRIWAARAAALVVVGSHKLTAKGEPNPSHAFDAGAGWMSLALQAHLSGWIAHAMGGFDKEKAAQALALPPDHELHCAVAIGRQGPAETLPEHLRPREAPNDRLPLDRIAAHGCFPPTLA